MRLNRVILLLDLLLGLVPGPTLQSWSQSNEQAAPPPSTTLPAGTIVRLRLTEEVDSKHVKLGDTLPLEVIRDVKIGDLVVIAKNTPVAATVSQVRRAPRGLRPGSLALEVKTINDINGNPIAVAASKRENGPRDRQGEAYTEAVLSTGFLAPPIFFLHGDEAVLPKGAEIDAVLSQDVALNAGALRQRWTALEAEQAAARAQIRTGQATVHFYLHYLPVAGQKHPVRHYGDSHTVLLDAHKLVRLRDWSFYDVHIAPGHHLVACKGQKLELDTQADEEYYVSIVQEHHSPGLSDIWAPHFGDTWVPRLTDAETGEEQVYPLTPALKKDVYFAAN